MNRTPVYIVCSPRPRVGKTLVSRLLAEYLDLENRYTTAFDINLNDPSLLDYLPKLAETASIDDTFGQMQLMDRLIVNDGAPKVVDLGFHAFDSFFKMADGNRLRQGGRTARRADVAILFIADRDRTSQRAWTHAAGQLQQCHDWCRSTTSRSCWVRSRRGSAGGPARHRGLAGLPEDLYRPQTLFLQRLPEDVD